MSKLTPYQLEPFQNRTIRIGIAAWSPYVNPCAVAVKWNPRSCKYPGIMYEILLVMLDYLGLHYEFVPHTENVDWGSQMENKSYSGLLGDVNEGRIDTVVPQYYTTSQRRQAGFQFSTTIPFNYAGVGWVIQRTGIDFSVETSQLLYKVFKPLVWELILLAGSLLILLLFLSINLDNWKQFKVSHKVNSVQNYPGLQFSAFWRAITAALDQYSSSISTGTYSGNQAMVLLGVLVLFVTTLYQGILVGILMNYTVKVPFEHQSQLNTYLKSGHYEFTKMDLPNDEMFYWDEIEQSELQVYKDLWSILKQNAPTSYKNKAIILDLIENNPNLIYPGLQPVNGGITLLRGRCNLQFIPDMDFVVSMMSFPWNQNNSRLKDLFSQALGDATPLIHHIETRYVRLEQDLNKQACPNERLQEGDPLKIQHFSGVFTIFLGGLIVGGCVLVIEKLYNCIIANSKKI